MQKIKPNTSKIKKWLPLILCVLSLSYCMWWLEAPAHLEQLEDDEYVGKTLLIYPTAGRFKLKEDWYFGKRKGDSWFTSQPPKPDSNTPPKLYRIMGYYKEVYHGSAIMFAGSGLTKYLVEPVVGEIDRRLFTFYVDTCEEQTNLTDPDTGIKIDLVCK